MAGQLDRAATYQALQIQESPLEIEMLPRYARFARAAAGVLADYFARKLIVGPDGSPVDPIRAQHVALSNQHADEEFPIPGLRFSYPALHGRSANSFLLYDEEALASAKMRDPAEIADSCGRILRRVLEGTPLWDKQDRAFRSLPTPISYDEFIHALSTVPVPRPEAPVSTELIADYADRMGGVALRGLTDGEIGPARLERGEPYTFNPKSEALMAQAQRASRLLTARDGSFILDPR